MKTILTIAGSDSSGGAGIQADLKTFEAHGLFGASCITALTAQNTMGVYDIYKVEPKFIEAQIKSVLDDFDIKAIKIGMLFSQEIIEATKRALEGFKNPVVVDPVFISKSNSLLLKENAIESLKAIFEIAAIITPNMYEAYRLFGYVSGGTHSLETVKNLPFATLVKNHLVEKGGAPHSVDILYEKDSKTLFETPLSSKKSTHGTGCSYSSAIAANLALGYELKEAVARAKMFVYFAIEEAPMIGKGIGPIAHQKGYKKMKEYYGEEI